MSEHRRLAAILVADVVGYSKLIGSDEAGTLAQLQALRTEVIEPQIAKHAGRLFKSVGDGFLVEFASAVQAVSCAKAIQEANGQGRLPLRIGIHVGDVVVQGDDLLGDGVNVAARIEGVADPGGIALSRQAHDQVRDRLDVGFVDKGEMELKNIQRPVQVFVIGPTKVDQPTTTLSLPDKPSIAVLPFQNMSGDPEQEFFTDGMVEDIITELSRFRSLFVIARNSTFTYKGKAVDVRTVAKELGVRYVLEGSCRRASDQVRVTAQLIDGLSGNHIWAERYDRKLHDIFVLQEELTRSIVAAIAPQVEAAELIQAKRMRARSLNLQSYELALRARAHATDALANANREARNDAIAAAESALQIDATCQLAWTTLAWLHWQHAWFWTGPSTSRSLASAIQAANKAIELDALHHEPHAHKSFCLTVAREYEAAVSEARLATELNPNAADALQALGAALMISGSTEAAIESLLQALRLNPRDPAHFVTYCYLSISYFLAGDYPKAVEWGLKSKHAAPSYAIGIQALAQALAGNGQIEAARSEMDTVRRLAPDFVDARLSGNSPFAIAEHRERQVRLLRLAAGIPDTK